MQLKEFKQNVKQWSLDRKIIPHSSSIAQMGKTLEEIAELWQAIVKKDEKEIKDAIGDIAVTLVNVDYLQCMEEGDAISYIPEELLMIDGYGWEDEFRLLLKCISGYKMDGYNLKKAMECLYGIATSPEIEVGFWECLDIAWDEIKDRKGTMGEDGVFYKE